jgi:hypothetical protein
MAYKEAQYEDLRGVPKKISTSNPAPRKPKYGYLYTHHTEDRTGGSCQMSCHEEDNVSYQFYHLNGTGWGVLPNGEKFERNLNCSNKYTLGGDISVGNGIGLGAYGGAHTMAAAENSSHYGKGRGVQSIPASKPERKTIKSSCDSSATNVIPGDYGMVIAGTLGMAAQELNMRSIGNCNLGAVEGSLSLIADKGMSCGSKGGTCQLGGQGFTAVAEKTMSLEAGGQLSVYTKGADIVISGGGGRVMINSPGAPPKTIDDVTKETNVAGSQAVPSPKVIGA